MTTATNDPRLRGPHTADGQRILAFCSWLVEKGDTLIDNYGEWYLAAGPCYYARFLEGRQYTIPVLGGHTFSTLEWKAVDDFRYGQRIERDR